MAEPRITPIARNRVRSAISLAERVTSTRGAQATSATRNSAALPQNRLPPSSAKRARGICQSTRFMLTKSDSACCSVAPLAASGGISSVAASDRPYRPAIKPSASPTERSATAAPATVPSRIAAMVVASIHALARTRAGVSTSSGRMPYLAGLYIAAPRPTSA